MGHCQSHRTSVPTTKVTKRSMTDSMTQAALIYGCPAPAEHKLPLSLGASCTGYLRKFGVSFGYYNLGYIMHMYPRSLNGGGEKLVFH